MIMIGDQIGEERGQVLSTRVLPSEPGQPPRMEISVQAAGSILGIPHNTTITYEAVALPDGTLLGQGQGVSMSNKGDVATWTGGGAGRMTGNGGTEFRGAIYYRTESKNWSRLNGMAVVYEYSVDESGKTEAQTFEWK
jgi:hypothetical protein